MSELTPKQDLFLEYLFNDVECQGNTRLAAERAGYSSTQHSSVVRALKDEILEHTQLELAMTAPRAAAKLVEMMDEDGSTPKAEIRLKAVESLLDRTGLSKKQEMEIKGESAMAPIFFIPTKQEVPSDGEN